jgi:alkylation response protein AidB-like acyl-CoA dehydrogenase
LISFSLSEEQNIVRSTAAEFSREVLRPLAREADKTARISRATLDQIWSLGIVEGLIDQADGEPEQVSSAILGSLVLEELGWGDATFAMSLAGPLGFARAIAEQGSAAQKAELLPLFTGTRYHGATVAVTEPGFLKGIKTISTTAERTPSGFVLQGTKVQVPLAADCSHFLVVAKLEGKLDAFIVPANTPGVSVVESETNLALASQRLATVSFNGVELGANMRLGENQGCDVQRMIDSGRVGIASILVGVCRGVYEHSMAYTKERVVHGSALARKQSVAFRLVDMFTEVEACRWMCWRAATHLDKRSKATRSATLAHLYTTEQAAWITDEGVQLMGGHGFMTVNPVELWYRNTKTLSLLEGVASV